MASASASCAGGDSGPLADAGSEASTHAPADAGLDASEPKPSSNEAGASASDADGSSGASDGGALPTSPDAGDAARPPPDDAGSPSSERDAGSTPPQPDAGDAGQRTGIDALLCDGRPGITFAGVMTPGGFADPGGAMLSENGHAFLIVEGTCRFWVQRRGLDRTFTGDLSDSELQRLRQDLLLARWQTLAGDYLASGFDGPTFSYVLGRGGIQSPCRAQADGGGCIGMGNVVPSADINALNTALLNTARRLSTGVAAASGSVRYLLVRGAGQLGSSHWSKPGRWPLGAPDALAIDQSMLEQYARGTSRLATGADAAALREVWRQYLNFEISGRDPAYPESLSPAIPIELGGARYQLLIRDSTPLENANGLIEY